MKTIRKRLTAILCLITMMMTGTFSVTAKAEEQPSDIWNTAIEKAISWLENQKNHDGSYGDTEIINDTCDAVCLLNQYGKTTEKTYLEEKMKDNTKADNDRKARYIKASSDQNLTKDLLKSQNEDGGFGLDSQYTSSLWDTLLVLEALNETETVAENSTEAKKMTEYIINRQNPDGSYAQNTKTEASLKLTARITSALAEYVEKTGDDSQELQKALQKTDILLKQTDYEDLENGDLEEKLQIYLCLKKRNQISSESQAYTKLPVLQKKNGSYGEDIKTTILAIKALETMKGNITINSLTAGLSTYTAYTGEETEIKIQTRIKYTAQRSPDLILSTQITEKEKTITQQTEKIQPDTGTEKEKIINTTMTVKPEKPGEYTLRISLSKSGKLLAETLKTIKIKQKQEKEINLEAETIEGKDYRIKLDWNQITDEETRYGYRIWRKTGEKEWETRSSWNGEEKVKILNIYPCSQAENYLKEWLTTPVEETGEPAGKDLFEIETIYIEDFNQAPGTYLKNTDGEYKYDVLVFGIYDSNAGRDINSNAVTEIQKYIDTGRGVLFGHDTVGIDFINFPKFAEQLGMIINFDGHPISRTTKVEVTDSGIITSYPWKLTGELNIPATHTVGQYTGGNLPGTVWMKLKDVYSNTYKDTGATNDAYLSTNNQLAMIQTGDSNGQATDDERKIIANTLFYLKQITEKNNAEDKSFYDSHAPEIKDIQIGEIYKNENGYAADIKIKAQDKGTEYTYYIEGIDKNTQNKTTIKSNEIKATALSGINKYHIEIKEIKKQTQTEEKKITLDVPYEKETTITKTEGLEAGKKYEINITAEDNKGNQSKIETKTIDLEKIPTAETIKSTIKTDKEIYTKTDTVNISLTLETPENTQLEGTLQILNENGEKINKTEKITPDLITGTKWEKTIILEAEKKQSGKYKARIIWNAQNLYICSSETSFEIKADGNLTNHIEIQQINNQGTQLLAIKNKITNTSSNKIETQLEKTITIHDEKQNKIYQTEEKIDQLQAREQKENTYIINTENWEHGTYKVTIQINKNGKEINTTEKTITNTQIQQEKIQGKITAQDNPLIPGTLEINATITTKEEQEEPYEITIKTIDLETLEETTIYKEKPEQKLEQETTVKTETETREWGEHPHLIILTAEKAGKETTLSSCLYTIEKAPQIPKDCTILAGEKGITIRYSQAEITGKNKTNGNFTFIGTELKAEEIKAAGEIKIEGTGEIKKREENTPPEKQYDYTKNLKETETPDLETPETILGKDLIKPGAIELKTISLKTQEKTEVIICSLEGDITIDASAVKLKGIIYAPKGKIHIKSAILEIQGAIIAEEILLEGSQLKISR